MKKALIAVSLITAAAFLTGCAAPNRYGVLFSDSAHAMLATDNKIGSKVGESKITNILGICTGDASIATAAKNAGITKVATVDFKVKNYLCVYSETTITVTGE